MTNPNREHRPLTGNVALITGGSRGIGLAVAKRLGRMGARVAICARNPRRLETASRDLLREGTECLAAVADVRQAAEISALLERVEGDWGAVDILVNNAGLGIFGAFHERSEEEWDTVLDTNLKSVFLMSRAIAPKMIQRGSGQIINVSSLAGRNAFPSPMEDSIARRNGA